MDECSIIRHRVFLHLDGELDEESSRRVHEHLNACAPCREIFVAERWIHSGSRPHVEMGVNPHPRLDASSRVRRWPPVITRGVFAGLLGLMAIIAYVFVLRAPEREPGFLRLAVAEHERYLRTPDELQIRDRDAAAIAAQLERDLPFQLGLSSVTAQGVTFVGGATLSTSHAKAALVMFRVHEAPVSLLLTTPQEIVAPVQEIVTFKNVVFHSGSVDGYDTLQWSDRRMMYVLVSSDPDATHHACIICHNSRQGLSLIAGFF